MKKQLTPKQMERAKEYIRLLNHCGDTHIHLSFCKHPTEKKDIIECIEVVIRKNNYYGAEQLLNFMEPWYKIMISKGLI